MILWNDEKYSKRINSAIFPGTQGGPLMNIIAAKAQCFSEALEAEYESYSRRVINNAISMCEIFNERGIKLLTGGTDSHIILIDLSDTPWSGKDAANALEKHGITVNKNGIPNDPRSFLETSGIRIGTAAETTRGYGTRWFEDLAAHISIILSTKRS